MTDVKAIAKEVVKELKRGQSIVVTASDIALMCAYYSGGYWCNEEGRLYNIGDEDDVQFTSWE